MNSRNTGVSGRSWRRLLEAAEIEDSKSFIPVSVVGREPVSHASRTVVIRGAECVIVGEDVWLFMCGCVCVVFDNKDMPAFLAFW